MTTEDDRKIIRELKKLSKRSQKQVYWLPQTSIFGQYGRFSNPNMANMDEKGQISLFGEAR
jgi:hypothetical protein